MSEIGIEDPSKFKVLFTNDLVREQFNIYTVSVYDGVVVGLGDNRIWEAIHSPLRKEGQAVCVELAKDSTVISTSIVETHE